MVMRYFPPVPSPKTPHPAAPQVIPCGLRLIGALGWLTLPNCHGAFDFSALDALNFCSRRGGAFSKEVEGKGKKTSIFVQKDSFPDRFSRKSDHF